MFTMALVTIADIWKQPKCPSVDTWIKKQCIQRGVCVCVCVCVCVYVCVMEYYSDIKITSCQL